MYGITRSKIKSGKFSCWQVAVYRRGMSFSKSFSDLTWDGMENALAAAKRYRDAMLQRVSPLTMLEYVQTIKVNNTSGFAGVICVRKPSGVTIWRAAIQLPGGKRVSKTFSERVYGSQARELAIQTRQEMLSLVDETRTFTRSPGAIAKASPIEFPAVLPRPPHALTVRVRRIGINGGVANKNIYVSVSDAISPRVQKLFSTGAHGQAGAFRLAIQAALKLVTQFGGEEVAQIFVRDYVEKYKRLPKEGISARIRFADTLMPVENAAKIK